MPMSSHRTGLGARHTGPCRDWSGCVTRARRPSEMGTTSPVEEEKVEEGDTGGEGGGFQRVKPLSRQGPVMPVSHTKGQPSDLSNQGHSLLSGDSQSHHRDQKNRERAKSMVVKGIR